MPLHKWDYLNDSTNKNPQQKVKLCISGNRQSKMRELGVLCMIYLLPIENFVLSYEFFDPFPSIVHRTGRTILGALTAEQRYTYTNICEQGHR